VLTDLKSKLSGRSEDESLHGSFLLTGSGSFDGFDERRRRREGEAVVEDGESVGEGFTGSL